MDSCGRWTRRGDRRIRIGRRSGRPRRRRPRRCLQATLAAAARACWSWGAGSDSSDWPRWCAGWNVTFSDYTPQAIPIALENARRNGYPQAQSRVDRLARSAACGVRRDSGLGRAVQAARATQPCLHTIDRLLAPGGVCWIGDPGRFAVRSSFRPQPTASACNCSIATAASSACRTWENSNCSSCTGATTVTASNRAVLALSRAGSREWLSDQRTKGAEFLRVVLVGQDTPQPAQHPVAHGGRQRVERLGIDQVAARIPKQPGLQIELPQAATVGISGAARGELGRQRNWCRPRDRSTPASPHEQQCLQHSSAAASSRRRVESDSVSAPRPKALRS